MGSEFGDVWLEKLQDLREYVGSSEEGLEKRWHLFHNEIKEAYDHLQKAFTK